jgi:large subunit ribosomal protein L24
MATKLKIKKGDNVSVIAGEDKGKTGRVLEVYPKKMRVLVEEVNIRTVHLKPSQRDQQGGRKTKSLPIHYSNVMLMDSAGKNTRIGTNIKVDKNGVKTKVRIAKTNGSEL